MVNLSINYIPGIKSGTRLDSRGLSPRLLSVIGNQNFSVGVRPRRGRDVQPRVTVLGYPGLRTGGECRRDSDVQGNPERVAIGGSHFTTCHVFGV